jgi:hypothetical protein
MPRPRCCLRPEWRADGRVAVPQHQGDRAAAVRPAVRPVLAAEAAVWARLRRIVPARWNAGASRRAVRRAPAGIRELHGDLAGTGGSKISGSRACPAAGVWRKRCPWLGRSWRAVATLLAATGGGRAVPRRVRLRWSRSAARNTKLRVGLRHRCPRLGRARQPHRPRTPARTV